MVYSFTLKEIYGLGLAIVDGNKSKASGVATIAKSSS
jgi:hypothetical protein